MVGSILFLHLPLHVTFRLFSMAPSNKTKGFYFHGSYSHISKSPKPRFYHLFYNESYPNFLFNDSIPNPILSCNNSLILTISFMLNSIYLVKYFTSLRLTFGIIISKLLRKEF